VTVTFYNIDVHENWANPNTCVNRSWINADKQPYDGFIYSASLSLPANGILVFASSY